MTTTDDIIAGLEATGEYRFLKKLCITSQFPPPDLTVNNGCFVDVETTGLNHSSDRIIEVGIVPFTFSADGRIWDVGSGYSGFQDPCMPLSPEIVKLTGITDDDVVGQVLDRGVIRAMTNEAKIVIAHHADFDRKFMEGDAGIERRPWACSMSQIDWRAEGAESSKLGYLAMSSGFFFDGHRAVDDCLAGIEMLRRNLPSTGKPAMATLLERARKDTFKIRAMSTPFATKDLLKMRGYKWDDGHGTKGKCWYKDCLDTEVDPELNWLRSEIYRGNNNPDIPVEKFTAWTRYA